MPDQIGLLVKKTDSVSVTSDASLNQGAPSCCLRGVKRQQKGNIKKTSPQKL